MLRFVDMLAGAESASFTSRSASPTVQGQPTRSRYEVPAGATPRCPHRSFMPNAPTKPDRPPHLCSSSHRRCIDRRVARPRWKCRACRDVGQALAIMSAPLRNVADLAAAADVAGRCSGVGQDNAQSRCRTPLLTTAVRFLIGVLESLPRHCGATRVPVGDG
jgi:hypothetical protein